MYFQRVFDVIMIIETPSHHVFLKTTLLVVIYLGNLFFQTIQNSDKPFKFNFLLNVVHIDIKLAIHFFLFQKKAHRLVINSHRLSMACTYLFNCLKAQMNRYLERIVVYEKKMTMQYNVHTYYA